MSGLKQASQAFIVWQIEVNYLLVISDFKTQNSVHITGLFIHMYACSNFKIINIELYG